MSEQGGFGLALVKEEGASYTWDHSIGGYRKMTTEEVAEHRQIVAAYEVYKRTFRGRFEQFLRNAAAAWRTLWGKDDGL